MLPISIAISPCPNDTFIVDYFLNKSKQQDFALRVSYFDIQQLNELALEKKHDVIKVSVAMLPFLLDAYQVLRTGTAIVYGNGPLLIAKKKIDIKKIQQLRIVSPGANTTANLLFQYFFKNIENIRTIIFSEIEREILENKADVGIVIHESRFTYEEKGLIKIADLGDMWEKEKGLPIPLGCFLIKKNMPQKTKHLLQQYLQESILKSQLQLPEISQYIKSHAQAMDIKTIRQHIELYVNEATYDLDSKGINAIEKLILSVHQNIIFPKNWI